MEMTGVITGVVVGGDGVFVREGTQPSTHFKSMPLFASFDSIYTETTSEALPEFSLTLHEDRGTEYGTPNPTLIDHDPNSIHDKLIDFDVSEIPEIILSTEPDSYNPINPFDYIQPDIDPVMQMELAAAQGDAWAWQAAGSHGHDGPQDHMYDVKTSSGPNGDVYHKHDHNNRTTTTTTIKDGKVVKREVTGPNGETASTSKITADSESGGARIAAKDALAVEALEQAAIEMSYNESLRGDNRFVFEPFHAMSNLGDSPVLKEASNWDVICDIGTSIKQANATHQLQDLGYW